MNERGIDLKRRITETNDMHRSDGLEKRMIVEQKQKMYNEQRAKTKQVSQTTNFRTESRLYKQCSRKTATNWMCFIDCKIARPSIKFEFTFLMKIPL